jgi:biopolymer transport protein ExbD
MSQGVTLGGDNVDPNLTPMLDVVLNLLLFFIVGYRAFTEQVDQKITLPLAQSARPVDKDGEALFLNLNDQGRVSVIDGTTLLTKTEQGLAEFLKDIFEKAERLNKNLIVVIRADEGTSYQKVFDLMKLCKQVGFRRLRVRANIG